jgi:hypothetical protein
VTLSGGAQRVTGPAGTPVPLFDFPSLRPASNQARHGFRDGAGLCACDLCVPCEPRGLGAERQQRRWASAGIVVGVIVLLCLVMAHWAHAQTLPTGNDFCQGSALLQSSVSISISSSGAGEHQMVAPGSSNQVIQVCSYVYDLGGPNPTLQFDYGTQTSTACDTGTTHLTGAMTQTTRQMPGPGMYFTVPAGNQLCINLGGTSPTAAGVMTYVQK